MWLLESLEVKCALEMIERVTVNMVFVASNVAILSRNIAMLFHRLLEQIATVANKLQLTQTHCNWKQNRKIQTFIT